MATIQDDRTEEQVKELPFLVGGRDRYLSGWGKAKDGGSYAYWACRASDVRPALDVISQRHDLTRVSILAHIPRRKPSDHVHIYVWGEPR